MNHDDDDAFHVPADILLVDDDPSTIRVLARILAGVATLRFATSGEAALLLVREAIPDLILLDAEMPGMSGFDVCEMLKSRPEHAHIPVIFVTSHGETDFEVSGFAIGAADFISKPISAARVLGRVKAHLKFKRESDHLRRLSITDSLTGLANRRQFDISLDREWRRARRSGDALALLIIDVDHFKRFNDHYGHPAGDVCLRAIASTLLTSTQRPADLVSRWGGEEFAVLLPQTARSGAANVAAHVLESIRRLALPHEDSPVSKVVSVSIGVGCYDIDSAGWVAPAVETGFDMLQPRRSAIDMLQAADSALYAAKQAGRARAWMLDVSDVDHAVRAHPLAADDVCPALVS